jgi:hypothetical protein
LCLSQRIEMRRREQRVEGTSRIRGDQTHDKFIKLIMVCPDAGFKRGEALRCECVNSKLGECHGLGNAHAQGSEIANESVVLMTIWERIEGLIIVLSYGR